MTNRKVFSHFAASALAIEVFLFWGGHRCNAAIIHSNAPSGGQQIVYRNLDPEFFDGARNEELSVAEPYREYSIGLTNLASGNLLSKAKAEGWRYTVSRGTNIVGTAVLNADEKTGKVLGFNSLQRPGFAQETLEALRKAEKLPQVDKRDYEVRFLNVPASHFIAVWLHGESDDILIPLPPTFGRMNAYKSYSEDQIKELLMTDAEAQVKLHESNEKNKR